MLTFFRNSSLFKQLIVPMIVVGIIGASAIIASYFALQNSVRALGAMYTASGERLKTLQGIDKSIANIRALSLKHFASESGQDMNQVSADLVAVEHRIRTSLPILSKADMYGHQTTQKEAVHLGKVLAIYLAGIDEALQFSADFEKESAFEMLTRVETQHLASIQNAMQTLMQHTIEDIASSREDLITATNRNLRINFAIDILGGALLLGTAFYVSRRASVRIGNLLGWSQRISGGDLSAPLVSEAADEVGQLTNAMSDMVQNLARGRSELEKSRKDAETVADELRLYANAFDSSGQAMLISDRSNRIVNVNAAFTNQTGYSLSEVLGKDPGMLSNGQTPQSVYEEMWQSLRDNGFWSGELWDQKNPGRPTPSGPPFPSFAMPPRQSRSTSPAIPTSASVRQTRHASIILPITTRSPV